MLKSSSKDYSLLLAIAEHRILLIQQIAAINNIGKRAARKKMSDLYSKGYINISPRNYGQGKGRPENICSLSEKGIDILRKEGVIKTNTPNERILFRNFKKIDHEILINWFRIHLLHLQRNILDLSVDFISYTTPFLPLNKEKYPLISGKVKISNQVHHFTPDGVFSIVSKKQQMRLLFFLEADMSTETIISSKSKNNIAQKILNYQVYFFTNGYKRYQKKWDCELNGFRLLFITNTARRKEVLSRFIRETRESDFIWITDQNEMFQNGITAKIWVRGGKTDSPSHSIIGPTIACDLPLEDIQ